MVIITEQQKEKAVQKIKELNPNYELLSEFNGWREKITRRCIICGDVRTVRARSLIEKDHGRIRKCPVCAARDRAMSYRKSHEQFVKEMSLINPNIEIIGEYITNNQPIKCRCKIDGYEWDAIPHVLLQGHGCPECARKKQNRRNEEEYLIEMKNKQPDIIPIGVFTQSKDMMTFYCTKCGYVWETQAYIPLTREGYQCPKCTNHAPVTESEMIERLKEKNPQIEYVKGYVDMLSHATFRCKKCGKIWEASPANLLNDKGCPYCRMSHGERKILLYLDKLDTKYEYQYRFEDCIYQRVLPFDFYIPNKNLCIEFDGIQHFEPTQFNKKMSYEEAVENFKQQKIKDNIKNKYCEKNNINLLRIPYTELKNIETILNKYLS